MSDATTEAAATTAAEAATQNDDGHNGSSSNGGGCDNSSSSGCATWQRPEPIRLTFQTGLQVRNSLTRRNDAFVTQTGNNQVTWYMYVFLASSSALMRSICMHIFMLSVVVASFPKSIYLNKFFSSIVLYTFLPFFPFPRKQTQVRSNGVCTQPHGTRPGLPDV
jgi:hypothetical protein